MQATKHLMPHEISQHLDQSVVGQASAKTKLGVLLSMHTSLAGEATPIGAPNGLVVGGTGVGKTFTVQQACRNLELPFTVIDATALVPAGIVGYQIEDALMDLVNEASAILTKRNPEKYRAATPESESNRTLSSSFTEGWANRRSKLMSEDTSDGQIEGQKAQLDRPEPPGIAELRELAANPVARTKTKDTSLAPKLDKIRIGKLQLQDDSIKLAENGVIFIDEFDKLASTSSDHSVDVQKRLLRFVEGTIMQIGHDQTKSKYAGKSLYTGDILVIAAGAFSGIRSTKIRKDRTPEATRRMRDQDRIIPSDFVAYGIIEELVARLQVLIEFDKLTRDDLRLILENPITSPLSPWRLYLKQFGIAIKVDDDAVDYICDFALGLQLGARGLQQVIFGPLAELTSQALENKTDVHLTAELLRSRQ